MDKGSAKALPCLDLTAVSSSGHGGEYHIGYLWICVGRSGVPTLRRGAIAPDFKNKTRYTPYVSLGSQISHIATNKGNINRQCSIYNILSIENITLDSKQ